jgi:hypothetical protein
MSPAIARPRPSCSSGRSLICTSAMIEKIRPRTLNGNPPQHQHSVTDRIPKIKPAVAKELVLGICPAVKFPNFGGAIVGGVPPAKCAANSGNSPTKVQSFPPFANTGVCRSTRFSAIHRRNCSALIGPYSLPSCPMILYTTRLSIYSSSFSEIARPASAQTPRFVSATKSNMIFAVGLLKFCCASSIAARKFFPLRNNK